MPLATEMEGDRAPSLFAFGAVTIQVSETSF